MRLVSTVTAETPAQIIHWSGDSSTYNFEEFTVEVGTNYKLNIIRDGDNFSFIFNNLDSGNRLVDNLNYSDYIMATKHTVVTGGEWENRSDEIFPGHIKYISLNVNDVEPSEPLYKHPKQAYNNFFLEKSTLN